MEKEDEQEQQFCSSVRERRGWEVNNSKKKKEEEDDMTNSKNNKLGASMLNVIAGSSPPAVSRCRSPPRAVLPAPVDFSSCAHVNEG